MKTNDLKSGTRILLRNGWKATLLDSKKGNIRFAEVEGVVKESGSIYSHDIVAHQSNGTWLHDIEYTPSQENCRKMNVELFGG